MKPWFERYVVATGLLRELPFYAAVLAQLDCEFTTRVPVMAVRWSNGRFTLLINDRFFERSPGHRAGVLVHEIHHLVLGHLVHPRFFDVESPELMLLAMETSANEYVHFPLPGPIRWQQFRPQGMQPHQSTMQRYELLRKAMRHRTFALPAELDGHRGERGGDADGGDRRIAIADVVHGRALPGAAASVLTLVLERARKIADQLQPTIETADLPKIGNEGLRESVLDMRRQRSRTRMHGALLGDHDLEALIEELRPTPQSAQLDWRVQLRRFATAAPHASWHRPNRRQPDRVFEVPGRSWRAGERRLLVAIDTSASITEAMLAAIARELKGIAEHAAVTIVECDQRVRRVYPFAGALERVFGRGGTDLRPPFAPDLLRAHARDGVVYFTDGLGPFAMVPPPVPVLWVLIGNEHFDCPWGARAHIRCEGALCDDVPF